MSFGRFHDFRCYLPSVAHSHYTRAIKPQQELPDNRAPALHYRYSQSVTCSAQRKYTPGPQHTWQAAGPVDTMQITPDDTG